jgi:hypothetical protein
VYGTYPESIIQFIEIGVFDEGDICCFIGCWCRSRFRRTHWYFPESLSQDSLQNPLSSFSYIRRNPVPHLHRYSFFSRAYLDDVIALSLLSIANLGGVLFSLEEMMSFGGNVGGGTVGRGFLMALVACMCVGGIDPFWTGGLVMFEVHYERDWHFFEVFPLRS